MSAVRTRPDGPPVLGEQDATATAVGLAQADGLLSVHDRVVDHFPELAPPDPSAYLAHAGPPPLTMSYGPSALVQRSPVA